MGAPNAHTCTLLFPLPVKRNGGYQVHGKPTSNIVPGDSTGFCRYDPAAAFTQNNSGSKVEKHIDDEEYVRNTGKYEETAREWQLET